jgi:transcriptional regulator with XRE-family HTH domain
MQNEIEKLLRDARRRNALPGPEARRHLREEAGLTQADIAAVLRIDRSSVSRYESGARKPNRVVAQEYGALLLRLTREAPR